jgi:nucleoid-associated protein YgaU
MMMKNRASWLALLVLAAATLLMVFFVLPRISSDTKDIGNTINAAGKAVSDAVKQDGDKTPGLLTDAGTDAGFSEKMGRLSADANATIIELNSLFAEGRIPAVDAFNSARAKAITAIGTVAAMQPPEGLEASVADMVAKSRAAANNALAFLKSIPDQNAALATIGRLGAIFAGTDPGPAVGTAPVAATNGATAPATPGAATPAPSMAQTVPSFDVLRVEPDGSTVIAGRAAPSGKLEILDGQAVIAGTTVGAGGDFAVVLDQPLAAGDHQLTLKVTGKDGSVMMSEEAATISVPKDKAGELLAMVTKPGKASRLIATPQAPAAATPAGSADLAGKAPSIATTPGQPGAAPATGSATTTTTITATGEKPEVQVTAVEIESNRIFVAGMARAGAIVRAYADDKLIGEFKADKDGHFVIDGVVPLSLGDHTIRVDVVDASGKVLVRAAVPFNRPAGDIAVVAQPQATVPQASDSISPIDSGTFDKLRGDVAKSFGILRSLFASGKQPAIDQVAAGRSSTEIALKSLVDYRLPPEANALMRELVAKTSKNAATALAAINALPRDVKAVGDALNQIAALINDTLQVAPAANGTANAVAPAGTSTSDAATGPKTIAQAPLTESKNAVIIRRGDTLWQISRRIYGQGVRYTTIYLANQDQIVNPDRIQPGQIFGLPGQALPDSEELHRQRMHGGRPAL